MKQNRSFSLSLSISMLALLLASCGDDGDSPLVDAQPDTFERHTLLENIGNNVVVPTYQQFVDDAQVLATAVSDYCAVLETPDEPTLQTSLRDAWRAAMSTWQVAELMQFGPAVVSTTDSRDHIYSWPIVSPCAVDQDVMMLREDPAGYDIEARLTNRRGLDALEYLLFTTNLETVCAPQLEPSGWSALDEPSRRAARCAFASQAADDLAVRAQGVLSAWLPAGGNFLGDFVSAGEPGSSFDSAQDAVNQVFAALFYLDLATKDQKMAAPMGLVTNSCNVTEEACAADLESQYAHESRAQIAANLLGFRMLFLGQSSSGDDGVGFDDFLIERAGGDLATAVTEAIEAAMAAVEEVPDSMADSLQNDYSTVRGAHDAVKVVTDALKNEMPSVLELDVPTEAGGDTD